MNDDDLTITLRSQRDRVTMTTPLDDIISRGRSIRARRRIPQAAGTLGVAGAVAVVASVALPAGHPAGGHPSGGRPTASRPVGLPDVRLAAWTVTRQDDGSIQVTFREATDAAGLQRTLRADGVPASVTFTGRQNPACQPLNIPSAPFSGKGAYRLPGVFGFGGPQNAYEHPQIALVLHPSELPAGAGVQIWTSGTPGAADDFQLHVGLVKASPQCTGT
jgi:hypothetical protein